MQQMSVMKEIGLKLSQYDRDHSATETENLKGKTVDDLVAMKVLSPADAAYLHEHQITFYGYDPAHIRGDVPLLEGDYIRGKVRKHIVCYSGGNVGVSPLEAAK